MPEALLRADLEEVEYGWVEDTETPAQDSKTSSDEVHGTVDRGSVGDSDKKVLLDHIEDLNTRRVRNVGMEYRWVTNN